MITTEDAAFMKQALSLARKGRGRTSPNPMVGSVVVANGEVIGKAWYRGPGSPHAESAALAAAGPAGAASTVYVTLEPCTHFGRTPPCCDALIQAGVARVVVAAEDPDARVSGRGIEALRAAGIEVITGCMAGEAQRLNRPYFMHRRHGRPFVTYKAAATLDGKTSAADGSSRWITGPEARSDVQRLRAESDAICVGVGTVIADNPSLTVRSAGNPGKAPLRIVVDSHARTPPGAGILDDSAPTLVAVTREAPEESVERLASTGAHILTVKAVENKVSLPSLMTHLGSKGVMSLLLEGGPALAAGFREAGLIDRFIFYLAPKLFADGAKGIFGGPPAASIEFAEEIGIESVRRIGPDIRIEAAPLGASGFSGDAYKQVEPIDRIKRRSSVSRVSP